MIINPLGPRERLPREIAPESAKQSRTWQDDEEKWGANYAIDLDIRTMSSSQPDSDEVAWLEVSLDRPYCVYQVDWQGADARAWLSWICSRTDCSTCHDDPDRCGYFALTVSMAKEIPEILLPPVSGCRYGDRVKVQQIKERDGSHGFMVHEIVIIEHQGM